MQSASGSLVAFLALTCLIFRYKNRVLCYLLSHINAHSLSTAQLALLKSISAGSDVAKAQLLAPTIRSLVSGQLDDYFNAVDLEEFARLLAATFDESVASELNNAQSVLWDVFCLTLRYCFRSGMCHFH